MKKQNKKESNLLQILSHQPNKLATKIWVIINTPSQSCCATLSSASHKFSQLLYNNRPEKIINKKKSPPSLYLSLLTPKLSVSVSLNYKKVKNKKKLKKTKKQILKYWEKPYLTADFFFFLFGKYQQLPTFLATSINILPQQQPGQNVFFFHSDSFNSFFNYNPIDSFCVFSTLFRRLLNSEIWTCYEKEKFDKNLTIHSPLKSCCVSFTVKIKVWLGNKKKKIEKEKSFPRLRCATSARHHIKWPKN